MSGTPSMEDEGTMDTCSSGPATPMAPSNPGTPRSVLEEYRSTPPPTPLQAGGGMTPSPSTSSLAGLSHSASSASLVTQVAVPRGGSKSQAGFTVQAPGNSSVPQSKYTQLLAVIEDLGKDIRPTYSGSRTSAERLKRGIVHSRILVRECLMECERAARS